MKQKNEKLNWEDYQRMDFTQNVREFSPLPSLSLHFYFGKFYFAPLIGYSVKNISNVSSFYFTPVLDIQLLLVTEKGLMK